LAKGSGGNLGTYLALLGGGLKVQSLEVTNGGESVWLNSVNLK